MYIGIIVLYWGFIGIMEKKVETVGITLGIYWDNGKENGNYDILGIMYSEALVPSSASWIWGF